MNLTKLRKAFDAILEAERKFDDFSDNEEYDAMHEVIRQEIGTARFEMETLLNIYKKVKS